MEMKTVFTQQNGCLVGTANEVLPLVFMGKREGKGETVWPAVCVGENEGVMKAESVQTFPVHS